MSASAVYNAFSAFIQNDSIDLWTAANSSTTLAGLSPVLELFNIQFTYSVANVTLTLNSSETSVRLTGTGSLTANTSYPANIDLQYLQDHDTFSLLLAITTDWSFADFFGPLPPTLMEIPDTQSGISWYPSILNNMQVGTASFEGKSGGNGLQMTGLLLRPEDPYILEKTLLIGTWPLLLSGSVLLPNSNQDYPVIDLDAKGKNVSIRGQNQSGVKGPDDIPLYNVGLTLLIQPLIPPQPNRIAFSTIQLFGDFSLGDIQGRATTLLFSIGDVWSFSASFDPETSSLVQGLNQLETIFGIGLTIPMNFPILSDFYVQEIDIDLQNDGADLLPSFSLLNFAMTLQSDKTWDPPVPFVTINNVGIRWVWGWTPLVDGETIYTLSGSVFGTMNFGDEGMSTVRPLLPDSPADTRETVSPEDVLPVSFDLLMSLPDFIISGSLSDGSYIPIGNAFRYFFGGTGPSTGSPQMNITQMRFSADPIGQNYFADATIFFGEPDNPSPDQGWEINLGITTIILNELEFNIALNGGKISGGISGIFFIGQLIPDPSDYTLPRFLLNAEYPVQDPDTPQGWTLTGLLYPGTSVSLTSLVYQFIYGNNAVVPSWVPDIAVDRLSIVLTTGSATVKSSYVFGATISARWTPTIFENTLKINASASIDLQKSSQSDTATGTLSGTFSVNKIAITASLTLGVPEPTYLFRVQIDQVWLQATTSWHGEPSNRHQTITLQLGGVTLGDMLEYFVNLAAPTLGFRLDPPWDVLKRIDLSRFVLTIDPEENIVAFVFQANIDLVIAQLDSVGVRYTRNNGEGKVELILTGNFLGQEYNSDNPLGWDVINDPPPSVPGQGTSLIKLRYLGIGQHVTFLGDIPDTVAESLAKLKQDMTPPDEDNPLPATMAYSPGSAWLIGLDVQLMETIDIGFIFNDPILYGLSIALSGERAGALSGLRFEILYKKITDDTGMFRIEFQLPDRFRTIQIGVVSLTLGIVVVEIYTNGNFKIDLGFPYNRNFDRSFSLQALIFIGRGGFYLGVLNGDTSRQVPRALNGNFSPVIELGVGISAGVGREVRSGIFSGGAYIELEVIFQGVLAWFNPNSRDSSSSLYFKCLGIAALHGKVYGSVDFSVVKVSVTLDVYAQVSLIYESYQPLIIAFSAGVRAEASVEILFVTLHFSFEVSLEFNFVIGSQQLTPWMLGDGTGNNSFKRTNPFKRLRALENTHYAIVNRLFRRGLPATSSPGEYFLNWQPGNKVFNDSPRKAHLTLLPLFTIADVPVNWGDTIPVNSNPNYRTAFILFADTGVSAASVTAADCAVRTAAHSAMTAGDTDTSLLAADILVQGLLLYAINAVPRDSIQQNTITAGQLSLLLAQLALPQTASGGLSIADLSVFFNTNINLWISGDSQPRPDRKSGMILPLPPFLQWESSQGGNTDFSTKNKIGSWYKWGISYLLDPYFPIYKDNGERPASDDPAFYESFTSYLFCDFCRMIIQNGVKEMQKALSDTTVTVTASSGTTPSLSQIALTFPTAIVIYTAVAGNTLESVAESMGATPDELAFLNPTLSDWLGTSQPGNTMNIKLGVAPEMLGIANADVPFAVNQCLLGTMVRQVSEGETLQSIADLFQVSSVADMLEYRDPELPLLFSGLMVLQPDALFNLPQRTFTKVPDDFVQLRTAAVFFVRYCQQIITFIPALSDRAIWYAQAIAELNQELLESPDLEQNMSSSIELLPGITLSVPSSYPAAYNDEQNRNVYTTVSGDTLERIGYALALQQDSAAITGLIIPGWSTFKAGVTSSGENEWTIPACQNIPVEAGLTIELLVRQLICDAKWSLLPDQNGVLVGVWEYQWANIAAWISSADILAVLASVTVPNAMTKVFNPPAVLSFRVLAETYGLTVADASARLQNLPNLYADGTILRVKHLLAQDIDVLIHGIMEGDSFTSVINQSSRILMSGTRLPALKEENGHTIADSSVFSPLYDLTGQQFSIALNNSDPSAVALSLTVSSETSWITLVDSITVQADQTLAGLEETYPQLTAYNPGLNEQTFKTGMVLLTGAGSTLDYSYTNAEIDDLMPASGLSVVPNPASLNAPSVMKLSGTVPRTYNLNYYIELQSPVSLPIPQVEGTENITGNPGLWMFPPELLVKAKNGVSTLYEVLSAQPGNEAGSQATEILNTTFATLLSFKLKKLDEDLLLFNLVGADPNNRQLLLSISRWLRSQDEDNTKAHLLLAPAPNAVNTSGLTVLTSAATDTILLKTNLSTLSTPPAFLSRRREVEDQDVYFSTLASLADFLTLLWEGSVVGGTGYYFSTGQRFQAGAFDDQGFLTLSLLVIVGTQQAVAVNGRSLLLFNNCLLTAAGIAGLQAGLFIQSANSADPAELITQSLVPPGNVGFELLIENPSNDTSVSTEKEVLLRKLYSLLIYSIPQKAGSPYAVSLPGLPSLPVPSDGDIRERWQKDYWLRKNRVAGVNRSEDTFPSAYWLYKQVVPLTRFTLADIHPASIDAGGLPAPENDPYSGFGTADNLQSAGFVFGFSDVLGNHTGANGTGQGACNIDIGYTDNLISISDWPSTSRYFTIETDIVTSSSTLSAVVSFRPSELLPSPSQKGDANRDRMYQQQQRFAQIYYQMVQPGITGWLVSSVHFIADPVYTNKGLPIADLSPLWRFAAASYVFTQTLSLFQPALPVGSASLGSIILAYGIQYPELAAANAETAVQDLFGNNLPVVPAYFPYVEYTSVTEFAALPPAGWPTPGAEALLNLEWNISLPLRTGTILVIPLKTISTGPGPSTASLQDIATNNQTSVSSVAMQNAEAAVLRTGFEFTFSPAEGENITVTVTDDKNSFTDIISAFADCGMNLSVQALADNYKDMSNLFAINKTLEITTYIIKAGDTLSQNSSDVSTSVLGSLNTSTRDMFVPGTVIYFGNFESVQLTSPADTLLQFSAQYACPAELLLRNNPNFALPTGNAFVIPGTLAWPSDAEAIRVPYTLRSGDTLTNTASRFNFAPGPQSAAMQLAELNETMPGVLISGETLQIPVGGNLYTVSTGNNLSFASVLASLQEQISSATLQDVVTATSGLGLNPGGLLICPAVLFAQLSTPALVLDQYGIAPDAFALANSAMQNLVAPLVTLSDGAGTSLITQDNDTFNSLISRFATAGIIISADEIAVINQNVAFLKSNALAVLPPATLSVTVPAGQGIYAAPITSLQVAIRLLRPSALIYPDFKTASGTGPVEMAEGNFPAPLARDSRNSLTYDDFINRFQVAFPQVRLATGKVSDVVQDLWQIAFDNNDIKAVELRSPLTINNLRQPRFFALKPLYNYRVTRQVAVAALDSDGLLGETNNTFFQSVDVEVWASRFLADVARFLSGAFSMQICRDDNSRAQLQKVLDAKKLLTTRIADDLEPVLDVPDAGIEPALESAIEMMRQQLGINLSKAYSANVLVQYDVFVDSVWQSAEPPAPASLYGQGNITALPPLDVVPALSITAAKADLTFENSYLNFLVTLNDPVFHRTVAGNLTYQVSHIEFNITAENVPSGFTSSDWLTFIPLLSGSEKPPALAKTDPGEIEIPVPLKNFPELPKIVGQEAVQTCPDDEVLVPPEVRLLGFWNYELTYTHEHAEQDTLFLQVKFNFSLSSSSGKRDADPLQDVFTELSQYNKVADPLWNILNTVSTGNNPSNPAVQNAVTTFASLATNIAQYWSTRLVQNGLNRREGNAAIPVFECLFNAKVSYSLTDELESLTLYLLSAQPGPADSWPDVYLLQSDTGTFLLLEKQTVQQKSVEYRVPAGSITVTIWPVFKLVWSNLSLSTTQNAYSQVYVQRNRNLIDNVRTNPSFIFTSDTVFSPSIITPLNIFSRRIIINYLGATLVEALSAFFAQLLGNNPYAQKITIGVSYGFELVTASGSSDQGLTVYLPISLYADQTVSGEMVNKINDSLTAWKNLHKPCEDGGEWVFSLKLYSYTSHMLLTIERLVYLIS